MTFFTIFAADFDYDGSTEELSENDERFLQQIKRKRKRFNVVESSTGQSSENDERLLQRIKRKQKRLPVIENESVEPPKKRSKCPFETVSVPDHQYDAKVMQKQQSSNSSQQNEPSRKRHVFGRFVKKFTSNLRKQSKKLTTKFSRKKKCVPEIQATSAGIFVITNYREDKIIENINGFAVVRADQDLKNEST